MKSWPYYKQKARAIADELGHILGNFKAEGSNMQWAVCTKCKLPAIIKKDPEHFQWDDKIALLEAALAA